MNYSNSDRPKINKTLFTADTLIPMPYLRLEHFQGDITSIAYIIVCPINLLLIL